MAILMDFSSVAMASVMVRLKEVENDLELVRGMIFNTIRKYNVMHRDQFGEMVIVFDSKSNWRRDYFPEYKASRRKNRKASDHDWKAIFQIIDEVRDDVVNRSPYKTILVENYEADDVIGAICALKEDFEPILILSPDHDFIQLHQYNNVKQYSNTQKKWVVCDDNPLSDLEVKVMKGDSGDGVPNVLSEDDALICESKRQVPLTKKKLEMLREDPEALGTTVARRIIRNRTLIDLSRTPEEGKHESMKQFETSAKGSIMSLMTLFTKHSMSMMMSSLQDFEVKSPKSGGLQAFMNSSK